MWARYVWCDRVCYWPRDAVSAEGSDGRCVYCVSVLVPFGTWRVLIRGWDEIRMEGQR